MISIIKSVVLKTLRRPGYAIFTILFPIVLTLVVGNLTESLMTPKIEIEKKTVHYSITDNAEFEKVLKVLEKSENETFKFVESTDKEGILKSINDGKDMYLEIDGEKIDIFIKQGQSMSYTYLKSILESYYTRFSALSTVYELDKETFVKVSQDTEFQEISNEVLSSKLAPAGIDYYAITSLSMIILYMIMFPLNEIFDDKKNFMNKRIRMCGVSHSKYIISSAIGYEILAIVIIGIDILVMKYAIGVHFGEQVLMVYLGMCVFAAVALVIGILIAYIISDNSKDIAFSIIQGAAIPVFSFLGGAYMPISFGNMGALNPLFDYSPLRIINKSSFDMIYLNDAKMMLTAGIAYIVIVAIIVGVTVVLMKKYEEDRI